MINIINKKDCCGCHACYNICPKNAIDMVEDEKGFKYPKIDKEKCINCGLCKKVCPIVNNKQIINNPIAYACYNIDEKTRIKSSSGGIFTLLATEILNNNGVVFGASFDKEFNVEHIYIEKGEDIEKLRCSKYVQSKIGDTYRKVKKFLEDDRYVLFTGTPCQIEGLKTYLQSDYEKLYTQDIICHGVPSPKIWNKYKKYRINIDNDILQNINFRNKDNGWKLYNMKILYKNMQYKRSIKEDIYMKIFLKNFSLRDSCYNCSFKKKNRNSDITLGDFWGIQNIFPELDDDKGTSLVILNSEKGKILFENIKEKIVFKEANIDDAIKYNPSMIKSVEKPIKREEFFTDLNKLEFNVLVQKYCPKDNYIKKIVNKIKRLIKTIK